MKVLVGRMVSWRDDKCKDVVYTRVVTPVVSEDMGGEFTDNVWTEEKTRLGQLHQAEFSKH